MSDLPNQAIEQGATQVEKPVVPNLAEPSTKVAPLGVAEQQIISDINSNEDGNADEVLQNIAGMDSKTSIKIPPPIRKSFILIGQKICPVEELIFQARKV